MNTPARRLVGLLLVAILGFGGVALLQSGIYGWTIFIVAPVLLGGVASWVFRPATAAQAAKIGAITVTVALGTILVFKLDGVICIMMCTPLALPLGSLGSWLVYRSELS